MTPAPDPFSRSSSTPYFVIWDPFDAPDFEVGDGLSYEVTGRCIETSSGVIDWEDEEDVLELTGVLVDRAPPNDGQTCEIQVEITLRRSGSVDPGYLGGSFFGEQVRSLSLGSRP